MAISNQVEPELKLRAVREYLGGTGSLNKIAEKYSVYRSTLQKWLLNYEMFGEAGLQHRIQNRHYPEIVKRQAVESYLTGRLSIETVCKKYQLRSRTQLEKWILSYNGQKEFQSPGGRRKGVRMTMTSYQKRKAAVEYCIDHGKDYKATAASFGCTYQQIYGWVRAYHMGGLERLSGTHKKAQRKLPEVMAENRRLKAKETAMELELAVHRRLQQCKLRRLGETDFSGVRNLLKYQVIQQLHQEQGWPVGQLCEAVGVSRSAYYKWQNRTVSKKQSDDEELANLISEIYQSQHGIPGYRQMKLILERRYEIQCNLKRVYRMMHILNLHSVCRRKKHNGHKKKASADYIAENILNRQFTACRQNEKWLTDVTEFKYGEGRKAYLSAILDLYGRNIVSFSLSRKNDTALVLDTFEQAFLQFPDSNPLVHSDRGTQYTSRAFRERMERKRVCQSMSRPGKCLDNAPMEGFWGILKTEMYYLRHFDDYGELCETIAAYINFYNNERFQKRLGCMTPIEFLQSRDQ